MQAEHNKIAQQVFCHHGNFFKIVNNYKAICIANV